MARPLISLTPEDIAYDEEQEQMPGNVAELEREITRARDPTVRGILEKERAALDQRVLKYATPEELKSAGPRNFFAQFDEAPQGRPETNFFAQFDEPLPERSAVGEVLKGGVRSIFGQLPQQIGQAMKWLGKEPEGGELMGSKLYEIGQSLENTGNEYLEKRSNQLNPDVHNWLTNALASGAEMLAPSVAPLAVAALLPETIPAWVSLGLGAGSMSWLYGGSQAQQTYERGLKAGLPHEKARAAGIETGAIEAGGEILGTMALGWLFGMFGKSIAKVAGMDAIDGVFEAVKNPTYFKDFAKKLPGVYGTEIGTEVAQNWSEAAVEQAHGIPQEVSPYEQGLQAVSPTFGMTTLLAPFGLLGHRMQARQNTIAGAALEDAAAPQTVRMAAADALGAALTAENKTFGEAWLAKAEQAIKSGEPIPLGRSFIEPADPVQKILNATSVGEAVSAALETVKPGLIDAQVAAGTGHAALETAQAAGGLSDADQAELAVRMQQIAAEARTPAQVQAEGALRWRTEGPIAEQLRGARRLDETQAAYEARLEAENAGTVRGDQVVGIEAGQAQGGGRTDRGGNLQQEQAQGGGAYGAELRGEGRDRQQAGGEEQVVVPRGTSAARVFGKPVGELTDAELRFAATSHRMSAHREVAQAEISRREAATAAQAEPAAAAPATRTYTPEEGAKELGSQLGLEVTPAAKEEVPAAASAAAGTVEKAFGKKVVFVKAGQAGYDAKGKALWGTDGAVLPDDPSTLYVNLNSNRKWQGLIGHETLHALARTNPTVYNELRDAVVGAVNEDAFAWAGKAYGERTEDIQHEEIVANVFGDQMHEPRFWLEVFGRTGNVKALANAAFSALDKLRAKFVGDGRIDQGSREFVTDVKRVRSAAAKAYAAWQKKGPGITTTPTAPTAGRRKADYLYNLVDETGKVLATNLSYQGAQDANLARFQGAATLQPAGRMDAVQKTAVAGGAAIHSRSLESKPSGKYDFPPEIVKAVEAFSKNTPVSDAKGAAALVNTLAAEHRAKLLEWMDDMGAKERPVITLHEGDEARGIPTVYLLGWSYKEATEIHDHGDSRAGVRIMRGEIAERVFNISPQALARYDPKQPTGIDATVHQRVLHAGRTLTLPDPYIHEFVGMSDSIKDRDVTLHAYFPPLREMNYFTFDDGKLTHNGMWAEEGRTALESKPVDFSKFVKTLPRTEAGEVAGSRGMGTREVWNLVQRMERLAREGKPYKGWYRDSAQEILKAFKGDKRSSEIFIQLIAITSANREVKANFTLAEKALVQYAEGQPISVGSQATDDKINDLLYFGIPWDGRKTNNFYRDMMQEIGGPKSRETTQDMHMGQMALGKKQLNNSEYSFLDKVTKFVAERFGVKPNEAQAMIWVPQKARSLVRRYLEKGFHRGMSAGGMKRMALAEAAINYGSIARKRWAMLGPEVGGFPKAREIRAAGQQVTAEVKPTTQMAIGQALTKLSMARLQEYQKTAFNRVFGGDPGVMMRAFGLDRTQYRIVEGAGGYDAMLAPNSIITLNTDAATAERVAKGWMYIFRQNSVPFFRADDKLLNDPKASAAVKIRFSESFSNTTLRSIYDNLRAQVEPGIGLTKLDHNVIAVVNYRDETGKPFLMSDEDFYAKLGAAVQANDLGAKINGYGRFGAETAYPYHDWTEDPGGQGLLSAAAGGRSDLQARLGRWSNIFGKFAEGRAREAQRAAGVKPGAEAGRAAEAVALQSKPAPNTPEFKKWFSGSKVIDALGQPLVVYHGTTSEDIQTFEKSKDGGFHFGTENAANDRLGKTRGLEGKNIIPAYLSVKNPKRVEDQGAKWHDAIELAKKEGYDGLVYQNSWEGLKKTTQMPDDIVELRGGSYGRRGWQLVSAKYGELADMPTRKDAYEKAAERVSMGVVASRTDSYVAFYPEQIKSVFNERPTGATGILESKPTTLPQFERWSEGTKVVDAEGDPKVVYHGTSKDVDFKAFKVNERGAWFTSDPEVASDYASDNDSMNRISSLAGKKNRAARVMPVFLQIKNPYTPNKQDAGRLRYATNYAGAQREIVRKAKAEGYDGIDMGGGMWVAFKPEQIKSVFNSGAYSERTGDILQSKPRELSIRQGRPSGGPRITWAERPTRGTWVSETGDGRYSIEPEADGYWAMVEGEALRWETSRSAAIATMNDQFLEDIAEGKVINPLGEKTITRKYKPEQTERVVAGLKTLAKVPGVFRLATSESKKLLEVIKEVDTEKVVDKVVPMGSSPEGTAGITYAITFKNGKLAFVVEDDIDKTAHVDAAMFDKGSAMGSFLYPAVLNWAKNSGLKLVVDPNGLTLTNTFRRTEQMLSGALKLGTTKYMSPVRYDGVNDQGLYGWNEEPKTAEDENKNLAIMALTSMENTLDKVPEAKDYHYDFEKNVFVDDDGKEIGAKRLDSLVAEPEARQFSIGRVTLARAILINSLLKDAEGAKSVTAEGLSKLIAEPKEERTLALYSKPSAVTKTPEFKKWFGKSKVVDAKGEPLVVYHGGQLGIEIFDQDKFVEGGAYFTPNLKTAELFSKGQVYPVYLALKNPLILDAKNFLIEEDGVLEHDNDKKTQVIERAKAKGYDGLIVKNVPEGMGVDNQYIAFEPEQIKSAIGNRGTFNPKSPNILESKPTAGAMPEWVKKMPAETQTALRKAGIWAPQLSLRERWKEMKHEMGLKVLQGTLDQFAPVLRHIGEYPYKLLRMASSADTALEASLEYGRLSINSEGALQVIKGTPGFLQTMKPLRGEVERFLAWVAGNRAEQLSKEDREHLFGQADITALKSLDTKTHADDNFADGTSGDQRAAIYAEVLTGYNTFSKSILDIAEQAGLINAEGRAIWEKEFYVPFFREREEEVKGPRNLSGMVNQYAFKKLKGGEEPLHDLLANTMQNWSHLLNASLRNRAATATLEQAEAMGIARKVSADEKGSVDIMKDGKAVHYVVDDQLVLDAISSLGASPYGGKFMDAMSKMKHLLTVGTTMSPVFRIRHTIREQITALAANPTTYNFVKNWLDGFKYSSRNNPQYGNMLAGGSFFRMGMDLQDQNADYVKRLIAHGVDSATILDTPNKVTAALKGAWDWWKETGERSDSITRANIYRQVHEAQIAKGASEDKAHFEAAYSARDVMDYGLRGSWPAMRMITQVVPFMNARLQGLYKLGRGAADDPKRFSAVIGGVALATIALTLAYRGDKDFEEREEWDRDNNWWFKIGNTAFRIPKPFEVGAIATVIDRALQTALNGFDPESRERFAREVLVLATSQLNLNPIPQAAWPAIQVWANKDVFTGRTIESERDLNLPKERRVGPSTSATAQALGKAQGFLPEVVKLSPEQIDFLVNAYFGWVGAHVVATSDLALRPLMGMPEKPTPRIDNYFLVGDFVKELPANQSRFVEQFYTHLKETQQAFGALRDAQQRGQKEAAAELIKSPEVRLERVYTGAQRQIANLNQQARRVQSSDIDADAKRAQLDTLYQRRDAIARTIENLRNRRLQE